ncbi:MAG: hypothetical protein J6M10_02615 [Clostridia bacterium]|nr:hypothetical protein [Clostridia bacterium]
MLRRLTALLNLLIIIALLLGGTTLAAKPEDYNYDDPSLLTADQLYSQAAILIDADSGDVLFSKNERVRMHPASTTKIMTLLLGIESGYPLDQQIAIPQAAANIAKDSTLVPVFPGETMTFGDLLVGFMLNSGNDGANAVAVIVAGSEENFVAKMNARAAEIGCIDTHFANAHGYTDQNHYTTAYDLALITKVAMENETFRNIVAMPRAQITVNERGRLNVGGKHLMMEEDSGFYYEGTIGVKTGTTTAAGKCYVGAAEKDGATLISVIMKADAENHRWVDTSRLFDYGWTCYDTYTLDQMYEVASSRIASFVISNASEDDPFGGRLDLEIAQISNTDYLRMIERENENALGAAVNDFISKAKVEVTHDLTAPISMGEIVGNFSYFDTATGNTVTAKLVAGRDVAERVERMSLTDFFPFLKIFGNSVFLVLLAVLALLIILIMLLIASRRAARQRRRRRIYEQRRAEYMRQQHMQASRGYDQRRSSPQRNRSGYRRDSRRPR